MEVHLKEIPELYQRLAGQWLLFEILETNANQTPVRLRLLKNSSNKDDLYEFLMEDDQWNWDRQYLIVYADPSRPCTIA
ncbi:MAG: hypothetical protein D6715_02075 [Calditrichaeota bacterium]|nr:MAG: hypothetical protein D6715_02075 [Calditrichota bacterium]